MDRIPPRLWCIAAADAPIVAVFARMPGRHAGTCVLKWDWKARTVEEGAWARLRLKDRVCRLSPDGQFLMYVASGGLRTPFAANFGGGAAVSRLPWLASLTDIATTSVAGGGPSRHTLSPSEQESLWAIFCDNDLYYKDDRWPAHFGEAWRRADNRAYGRARAARRSTDRPVRLAATAPVAMSGLRLVLIEDRRRVHDDNNNQPRFYLESESAPDAPLRRLPGVRWAMPTREGRILAATEDGRLQCIYPKTPGDPETRFRVEQDHDLSTLKPNPGPAPKWATAPLATEPAPDDKYRSKRRRAHRPP